jgi:hypothetical protein
MRVTDGATPSHDVVVGLSGEDSRVGKWSVVEAAPFLGYFSPHKTIKRLTDESYFSPSLFS